MAGPKNKDSIEFKKGDHLFRAGQPAHRLYIIQQGLVNLYVPSKGTTEQDKDKKIDLTRVVQPQIIGEEALWGEPYYKASAKALNDTVAIPITTIQAVGMLRDSPAMIKSLSSGLFAKQNALLKELTELKTSEALQPCPLEKIVKMFSVVYHVANYTGKKKAPLGAVAVEAQPTPVSSTVTLSWVAFRKYCQRVFQESPIRLEQAMWLLSSVGVVDMEMVKNEIDEEAPDELGFVHFKKLPEVIGFAEFFRQNYDPLDPDSIKGTAAAGHDLFLEILNEIDLWNEKGIPRGMPLPVDPKNAAKKKAG